MHIIFSHGRSGRPDEQKIQQLSNIARTSGCSVESLDYTDTLDGDIRAKRLSRIVETQTQPFCLVGSSMGGYVSMVAAEKADKSLLRGLFLMAPALYIPRYQQQTYAVDLPHVEIVHGWDDDVVIFEHSIRYAKASGCLLHLFADNHQLNTQPETLARLFNQFLQTIK